MAQYGADGWRGAVRSVFETIVNAVAGCVDSLSFGMTVVGFLTADDVLDLIYRYKISKATMYPNVLARNHLMLYPA